jgi:cell division protein FtsI (penicillin-binding protein 3)
VRIALLATLLLAGAGSVIRRAWALSVERGDTLREMAEEQYLRDIRLSPKRGTVYDRHGAELAVSVDIESVWANPRELRREGRDPVETARLLATVLPIDQERIAHRLASDRYFVWIDRHVRPREAAAVRALGIPGVSMSDEARRFYPNRQLAAHILGFANIDGEGIEGLELAYEERLRGSVSTVPAIRDRRGRVVFSQQLLDDRAAQGDDVYLTIDKSIQHVAERELELSVRTFEARAGSVVVMEPETGEILAMASYPTFNPNEPGRAPPAHRRNRSITDVFEPGSTVKPFTIASALAAGTVRSDQLIDCEDGAMQVDEFTIHDSHAFDELTPAQILAFSSNIGTSKIGASMGRRGMFRAFRRFGFGEDSGLPLPGETSGILRHYRRWYAMDAATIPFGQGMSVNNVQMAAAMSVIANGGKLVRPIIVRRVTDSDGNDVEETLPMVRRQVVPRGVARLVADMMTAVTGPGGTGTEAAIDGYLVAGKTGTAQKADYEHGGYADDEWLASFVGFVPAENPRLVISVVIDEPVIAHYGGVVAAPVFRRVGEAALRHLGVPASTGGEALADHARRRRERQTEQARAERLARRAAREARRAARAAGQPVAEASEIEPAAPSPGDGETVVPDVMGRTARSALVALREATLDIELSGSGLVVAQSPAAGDIVPDGALVRVQLAPPTWDPVSNVPEPAPSEPVTALAASPSVAGGSRPPERRR